MDSSTGDRAEAMVLQQLRDAGDHPLMHSFPHGAVFAFDHDLRFASAGGGGLAVMGFSRRELEGRTIHEVYPHETAVMVEPYYRSVLRGESIAVDVPLAGRIYSQRLGPVRAASGTIVAGLGVTEDVSESREAEHALREADLRNRLTFDNAPIGKALVGLDGSWLRVNPAITRLTGYSQDELMGMTFQDITHPDDLDLDLDHLRRLIAGEIDSYEIEKRYLTAGDRVAWVLLSVSLVRDDDAEPMYLISQIQDITDRKRQNEALQDLTAMLAHDLRTPATVIGGFANLILSSGDRMNAREQEDYIERITKASAAMLALLENALTASTLGAGHLEASPQVLALDALVREIVEDHQTDLTGVDMSGLVPCSAWFDRAHLVQILNNLLTNAAKYGEGMVRVSSSGNAQTSTLTVADDGPGVETEFVAHLFDRFSRSDRARQGARRGSGLGLYIVQGLLTLNGGSVEYRKAATGGAEFVLTLPASPPDIQ